MAAMTKGSERCDEHGQFRCPWCAAARMEADRTPTPVYGAGPSRTRSRAVINRVDPDGTQHSNFCWVEHPECELFCRNGHRRTKETTKLENRASGGLRNTCLICLRKQRARDNEERRKAGQRRSG
jgi:hypothetical protein